MDKAPLLQLKAHVSTDHEAPGTHIIDSTVMTIKGKRLGLRYLIHLSLTARRRRRAHTRRHLPMNTINEHCGFPRVLDKALAFDVDQASEARDRRGHLSEQLLVYERLRDIGSPGSRLNAVMSYHLRDSAPIRRLALSMIIAREKRI